MTYKEALRIAQFFSAADAKRESARTDDLALKTICRWRIEEPDAFLDILDAAGFAAIAREERDAHGTYRGRVKRALKDWADLHDVAKDLGLPYRVVQRTIHKGKYESGWHVEKRRYRPGEPGFVYRIVERAA